MAIPRTGYWGIGHRMMKNLHRMGIVTLGQIAGYNLEYLKKRFGIMGEQLYWHAWGIDLSPVFGDFTKQEQKGYGHGIALLRDYTEEEVAYCILDLCEEACRRARTAGKAGRTIQLGIAYSKETPGGFSRSRSVDIPTNVTMDMYDVCMQLFNEFYDGKGLIRHVNVALTNLHDKDSVDIQLDLFEDRPKKNDIGHVMDAIRAKYGSTAILRASSYTDAGVTLDRSKKIGGHYT